MDADWVVTFLNFQWAYRMMQREYDQLLSQHGLSESKFIILMFLQKAEGHLLSPAQIAEKLGASRPTVTKLLNAMAKHKLVAKSESTEDKRSVSISITTLGLETLNNFLPYNFDAVKTLFHYYSPGDFTLLEDLLSKLNKGSQKLHQEMESHNANREN